MRNKKKSNIGVVTWPILKAGVVPLQQLVEILYPFSNELHVITGGAARDILVGARPEVHLYLIEQESTANTFVRVMNNVSTQLKISWRLCRIARHVDFCIFFFGGSVLLLPMLTTADTARITQVEIIHEISTFPGRYKSAGMIKISPELGTKLASWLSEDVETGYTHIYHDPCLPGD
jgi:hypothetical protein